MGRPLFRGTCIQHLLPLHFPRRDPSSRFERYYQAELCLIPLTRNHSSGHPRCFQEPPLARTLPRPNIRIQRRRIAVCWQLVRVLPRPSQCQQISLFARTLDGHWRYIRRYWFRCHLRSTRKAGCFRLHHVPQWKGQPDPRGANDYCPGRERAQFEG